MEPGTMKRTSALNSQKSVPALGFHSTFHAHLTFQNYIYTYTCKETPTHPLSHIYMHTHVYTRGLFLNVALDLGAGERAEKQRGEDLGRLFLATFKEQCVNCVTVPRPTYS